MDRIKLRKHSRDRRRRGLQRRIRGSAARPRLAVFRSSKHIYAQVVDDLTGRTIAAASTVEKGLDRAAGGNVSAASEVGRRLADRAKEAGVSAVVFDRGGFLYHGRVKAVAEGAREGGDGSGRGLVR